VKRETLKGELSAEFLGTFVLCAFGLGSVAQAVLYPNNAFGDWTTITLGWGLAVTLGVYVAGGISGAHINPAVTFGFAVRGAIPWGKVLPYAGAQMLGGFLAAALVRWNYSEAFAATDPGLTAKTQTVFSTLPNGVTVLDGLRDQVIGTALLLIGICALVDERNKAPKANTAPLMIGLLVTAIGIAFGAVAGYAINPARDFAPRLLSYLTGFDTAWVTPDGSPYWWVPIVGPLAGGAIGVMLYDLLIGRFVPQAEPEPGRVPYPEEHRADVSRHEQYEQARFGEPAHADGGTRGDGTRGTG
jgi:glycerol uptake facilitator protein